MNNIIVWLIILVVSIVFGVFSRIAVYNKKSKTWWFFDGWRDCVSYFMTGIIGYFLIAIRWPEISESGDLSSGDFILFLAFFIGVLGWWPYLIKNVIERMDDIVKKILKK